MMWFRAAAVLASLCVPLTGAIFPDEVDHVDFHHALLGTPTPHSTFFHRPSASSNASLLYTLSEKLFIGAVNPRDGSIVWRQDLAKWTSTGSDTEGFLRAADGEFTVVSAAGNAVLAWGAVDGKLVWDTRFEDGEVVKDVEVLHSEGGKVGGARDVLALSQGKTGTVRRLDGATGRVKWEYRDDSGDVPFQVSSSATEVFYVSLQSALLKGYKIKVTVLDSQTGQQTRQHVLSSESEVTSPDSVLFVGANAANPLIIWADKSFKALKFNIIGSKQVNTVAVDNPSGEEVRKVNVHAPNGQDSPSHFVVHYETENGSWVEVYHVDLESSTVSKAYQLPHLGGSSAVAVSQRAANAFFTRATESEISVLSSTSQEVLGKWSLAEGKLNGAKYSAADVVTRGDSASVRLAFVSDSGDWHLIQNGKTEWTRHESLAGIVAAAWAEPVQHEDLAHELEIESHENVLAAYVHRLKRHLKDLERLPAWLQELPKRIASSIFSAEITNLDNFGVRKFVVVATERGRVAALDTGRRGAVTWNVKVTDVESWDVKAIVASSDIASIYAGDGSVINLNVTTGDVVSRQSLDSKIKSVVAIPGDTSPSIIGIREDGSPLESVGYLVTLSNDGRVLGWAAGNTQSPLWQFVAPSGETILRATSRPTHDPVASIGKVLGDRSVLYKYLNPNLVLVTTIGDSTASFYLLDGISGAVLYSTTHQGVDTSQPITSAMAENWFAYSLYADETPESPAKGYQLVISELYESPIPNDRGPLGSAANYSSLSSDGPPRPHVLTQSFIIPEPISHMAVTQTRQGITIRQLLCTLPRLNSLVGIPRPVLDPRRPVGRDPTTAEREEGLIKYSPFLEFDGKWFLSHSRDVARVRAVIAAPTLLESTGLIFAFGDGDIFGSRVAPSQAFDILGKGFSKFQLLVTVVALFVGVAILAPMARRKQVNLLWKR